MIETVLVSVSGPAFSFLMYENVNSKFDQEGFLLGEVQENETKTITDNEQEMVKLERVIKINCAVPCPHTCYFYDSVGRINVERVQSLLSDKFGEVVAWYKFRHSPGFKLTLREKIIHKQLADMFKTPPDLFTSCLLTKEVSDNHSTHLFSQTFVRFSNGLYQPLPMHIVNLSDPNNSYRKPQTVSRTLKELLESANIDLKKSQGVKLVTELHDALQKEIENVMADIKEAKDIYTLEEEVKHLMQALKRKTEAKLSEAALEPVAESNSIDNGCGSALSDSVNDAVESSPQSEKRTTRARPRPAKDKTVKSDEQCAVKTRSQASNRVSSNISYSQATQGRK